MQDSNPRPDTVAGIALSCCGDYPLTLNPHLPCCFSVGRFLASRVSCLEDQQNFRESRSVTAIVVGSVLAGVGAGLAFSFPETVLLQLPFSPMTAGCSISGILLGVMMFSLLENKVESFREFLITDRDTGSAFLDQRYGLDYTRMTLMTGLSSILSLRLFHLLTEYENTEDHQRANPYRIGKTQL